MARAYDEPVMSDLTILVSVEDLISIAMGPTEKNTVNYKMIQSVLHILARQLRLLETQVELRISDDASPDMKKKKKKQRRYSNSQSPSPEKKQEASPRKPKRDKEIEKAPPEESKRAEEEKQAEKKEKGDKTATKDQEKSEKEKTGKAAGKDRDKSDKPPKDQKGDEKKRQQTDLETILEGMSPTEKEQYLKRREIEEQLLKDMSPKEKAKFLKEREKEEKLLKEMSPKERAKYLKDKEKEEELLKEMSPKERAKYLKEKEKEEELLKKMSPKERAKYLEDKEKEEELKKMTPKERAKYLKEKEKEEELLKKMTPKERAKYLEDKEHQLGKKKKDRSDSSITITEVERKKEKVLIVEKGPTTRGGSQVRVGSIDVVTRSQFELLQKSVVKLEEAAGPLPMPSLPANKALRAELAKGSASLTDTMQAMQVSARVQAAERGLSRMAELLTQLAAAGALPEDFVMQFEEVKAEMEGLNEGLNEEGLQSQSQGVRLKGVASKMKEEVPAGARPSSMAPKSVVIDPKAAKSLKSEATMTAKPSSAGASARPSVAATAAASQTSRSVAAMHPITKLDLEEAIENMKGDLLKTINKMTNKASVSADTAAGTAKGVAEKMEVAMKLNSRITDLYGLTSDYAEQLSGFDAGLTTQMTSFREQMSQMRSELKSGLQLLESANNNAETAAVLELTERYEALVMELDATVSKQQDLVGFQMQLAEDLRSLGQAVETLREEKADRDEVQDGLRDKADNSKLAGLLTELEFASSRAELEARLQVCYEKFYKQDHVWTGAIKDLTAIMEEKAEIMQLLSLRDETQDALRDIQEKLKILAFQLGQPKTAILTRELSKDGKCATCLIPALMEMEEVSHGKPPQLLALRPAPDGEPCEHQLLPTVAECDEKSHACKRWAGGSHTLVRVAAPAAAAGAAPVALVLQGVPSRKYDGYGIDGKMYKMEEELQPCIECNLVKAPEPVGEDVCTCAGDAANVCPC